MGLLYKEGVNEVLLDKREIAKRLSRFFSIALPEENVKEISIVGSSLKWAISNIILTSSMLFSVIYILTWINLLCTMHVQMIF